MRKLVGFRPIGSNQTTYLDGSPTAGRADPAEEELGAMGHVADIAAAPIGGVRDAAQETIDFGVDVIDWVDNHTVNALDDGTPDFLTIQDFETKTTAGKMIRGISQFAAGFVGAGKFLKAAKVIKGGATGMRGMAQAAGQGAVTDFVAFDPHEGRLSNMVQEFPAMANPISDYLAADGDDTALEGRFKNAVEGIGLGAATDVLFKTVKGLKKMRGAKDTPDEARVAAEVSDEIDEAATRFNNPEPKPEATIDIEARQGDEVVDGTTIELSPEGQIKEAAKAAPPREAFDHKLYDELRQQNSGMSRDEIIEEYGDKLLNLSKAEGDDGMFAVMRSTLGTIDDAALKNKDGSWKKIETELSDLGDSLGIAPEKIMVSMERMANDSQDALKMTMAAKNLASSMAHQIKTLEKNISINLDPGATIADAAGQTGHPQATQILKLYKMREELGFLAQNIADVRTASARVTASGAAGINPTISWDTIRHGNEATHRELLDKLNIDPKNLDRYLKVVRMADKGDIKALVKLSRIDLSKSGWDKHNEYWINALLSGPTTHAVNLTSGLLKTAIMPATKMIGSVAYDSKTRQRILMEGGRAYVGMYKGLKDSFSLMRRAWKNEANVLDPMHQVSDLAPRHAIGADAMAASRNASAFTKVSDEAAAQFGGDAAGASKYINDNFTPTTGDDLRETVMGRAVDTLGKIIRLPSRALLSGDEFLKQINYRSELYSKLHSEGVKRFGDDSKAVAEFVEGNFGKYFDEQGAGLAKQSLQHAREATWTQDLRTPGSDHAGIGGWMQEGAAKHPGLRLITPFVRTPVNIARDFWQHTPVLNRLSHHYRTELAAGGDRAAMARGKEAVGGMVIGMGVTLAYNGMITGNAPKDPRLRETMPKGWQPLSIKVGDEYVSYARLEPFSMMLGMVADFANVAENVSEGDKDDMAASLMTAMYKNVASKTYLRGVIDLMDVISEQNVDKTQRWLNGRAAAYLPFSGALGQVRKVVDPEMREVRGLFDTMMNKVPGLSDNLPARRNWISGEAKEFSPGIPLDNLSPYPMSTGKKDLVFDELHKLGYAFTPPNKRISANVELSGEQLSRLHELTGTVRIGRYTMKQRLERLMKTKAYDIQRSKYDDGPAEYKSRRVEMVMQVMRQYKKAAKRQLFREDKELGRQVALDKRNAFMAKRGRTHQINDLFENNTNNE